MPDANSDIMDALATSLKLGEDTCLTGRAFHVPTICDCFDPHPQIRVETTIVARHHFTITQRYLTPITAAFLVLALGALVGCSGPGSVRAQRPKPAPVEANSVTCIDPLAKGDAWISDGLIGLRIGRDGAGTGPVWSAASYEPGGEERILPQPNPFALKLSIDGVACTAEAGQFYEQRFEFASRRLFTRYLCKLGQVSTTSWASGGSIRQTWRVNVEVPGVFKVQVPSGSKVEVRKDGEVRGVEFPAVKGTTVDISVGAEIPFTEPELSASIEIDGPIEDQQAVNSFLAYLKMAVPHQGSLPLSPNGLSADFYRGHVFWDADVWVFPALALLDPQRAKVIPTYRIAMLEGARANYATWIREREAMLRAGAGGAGGATALNGAVKFPWESAVSGKETMIGQFRQALHQNGAVLWGLNQAAQLGLADPGKVDVVRLALQRLWQSVSEARPDGRLGIRQVFGVDEFRLTDNDLITNLLADWTKSGMIYPPKPTYFLPSSDGVFQTYEGDQQMSFKQASAVLSIYPYQYPPAEQIAKQMMAYYAPKTSPLGPAMTEAIHATIYARMGETGSAYREWRKAWGDFTQDRPLLLFSEHRKRDRTYFVTGAAGCLQSVLYGFLGFRIDYSPEPDAKWSKQLRGGGWLSIKPHLPKEWKQVVVRNFSVLGQRYTAVITSDSVKVTQGDP